ncbi:hypothetical protein [Paraburkholderia sp. SIMBA_054]|uniref:hypothetical protein n=1 Tax=Paraburkholderia sp. SIMBA_054 TaxID=3085795 RepID=UPI003978BD1B
MLASRISATANAIFTVENTSAWSALQPLLSVVGAVVLIGWVSAWMAFSLVGHFHLHDCLSVLAGEEGRSASCALCFTRRIRRRRADRCDRNMVTVRTLVATARECLRFGTCIEDEMASRQVSLRYLEKLRQLHATLTVLLSCCLLGWVLWLWTRERATTGDVVLVSSLGFAILHGHARPRRGARGHDAACCAAR